MQVFLITRQHPLSILKYSCKARIGMAICNSSLSVFLVSILGKVNFLFADSNLLQMQHLPSTLYAALNYLSKFRVAYHFFFIGQ